MSAALFQAIVDDPISDAPRLAFAAACEADDPARAELIRLHCEYARLASNAPERTKLYERFSALLKTRGPAWIGSASPVVGITDFWRGFVAQVRASSADLLLHAPALMALAPTVHLYLDDEDSGRLLPEELLHHPLLHRVHSLELAEGDPAEQGGRLRSLLQAPSLQGLRGVTLRDAPARGPPELSWVN